MPQGLSRAATPVGFALRRLRERPLSFAIVGIAVAAGSALIGWGGIAAALAQEDNVKLTLGELPPADRAVDVLYYRIARNPDLNAATVAGGIATVSGVTSAPRRVVIWHPISPGNESGTRIVTSPSPALVEAGRQPRGCHADVCEALALAGRYRLGARVQLGEQAEVVIVGRGSMPTDVLADPTLLGRHALFLRSLTRPLRRLAIGAGATVITTAPLDPSKIHGFDVRQLAERLREAIVRIDRASDPSSPLQASAPLDLLDELADRGHAARARLLLVAGEAAALILAFAAFAAGARRRDLELVDDQLATMGASRAQRAIVRGLEALLPCIAGATVALVGLRVATELIADRRDLPSTFVGIALPFSTVLAICALALAGCVLLVVTATPRRSRYGIGPIELAGVAALALVIWETATTGALDPDQVSADAGNPVLLLLPALAFFGTAVVLLRVVPLLLRLCERLSRRGPFGLRLAFLAAARHPGQAAAATTFLAVAIGASLFSFDYRATLERQARDEAAFTAGATWRVIEDNATDPALPEDVTPLTRYARISAERPSPALRLDAGVNAADPNQQPEPVQVLGIPMERLQSVRGWRDAFSPVTRSTIAARLRPRPVRLAGVPIPADARTVRMWVRANTEVSRIVLLHFLLPGQRFTFVRLGVTLDGWQRFRAPLPRVVRGSELVAIEFIPVRVPLTHAPDLNGSMKLGFPEVLRGDAWHALDLSRWTAAVPHVGPSAGFLTAESFATGPLRHGLEFDFNGTLAPLIRPSLPIPQVVRALVSGPIAASAVDRVVRVQIGDRELPLRVEARASLFPTVVDAPSRFAVVDYDTLFAALNADVPNTAVPGEAWFFRDQPPAFARNLEEPPFRLRRAIGEAPLEQRLRRDPLASGTRTVLFVTGIAAALLALLGLVLSTRLLLASERPLLAEYEALGVRPTTLSRASQGRLILLSATGIAAALVAGFLAVRLIGAFVAVTGGGTAALPPIEPTIAWALTIVVVLAVAVAAFSIVSLLARHVFRESTAARLRA